MVILDFIIFVVWLTITSSIYWIITICQTWYLKACVAKLMESSNNPTVKVLVSILLTYEETEALGSLRLSPRSWQVLLLGFQPWQPSSTGCLLTTWRYILCLSITSSCSSLSPSLVCKLPFCSQWPEFTRIVYITSASLSRPRCLYTEDHALTILPPKYLTHCLACSISPISIWINELNQITTLALFPHQAFTLEGVNSILPQIFLEHLGWR